MMDGFLQMFLFRKLQRKTCNGYCLQELDVEDAEVSQIHPLGVLVENRTSTVNCHILKCQMNNVMMNSNVLEKHIS